MSTVTQPIKSKKTLKRAFAWLEKNSDESFALVYKIGATTGLRVTDITELTWDNIDFEEKVITVEENKGSRQALARSKRKVLEKWHSQLFVLCPELRDQLFITKAKDLLSITPEAFKAVIELEITQAIAQTKAKIRIVDLHPSLISVLKARKARFENIDSGFVFSTQTLKSNRAKGKEGVITRQSCHRVFKAMGEAISTIEEKVKGSCHGLRKTFARFLYNENNKDMNLVLQVMGWSSVVMAKRYIGLLEEERKAAAYNVFDGIEV